MHSCSKLLYFGVRELQSGHSAIACASSTTKHKKHCFVELTYIKDFKPSDVQHTDEELPGLLGVQHLIDSDDHPQEHFLID